MGRVTDEVWSIVRRACVESGDGDVENVIRWSELDTGHRAGTPNRFWLCF